MLELAQHNVTVAWVPVTYLQGRAEDLSRFADGEFERVMANFIFHYIEEPDVVLAEMARVLDPKGHAIVSIEARGSMPELYQSHFAAMERVGFDAEFIDRLPRGRRGTMTLDNAAEYLSRHFTQVEEHPYADALRFLTPEPFMEFYTTGHQFCGARAFAGAEMPESMFDDLAAEVQRIVRQRIADVGYMEITKRNSVFVCS